MLNVTSALHFVVLVHMKRANDRRAIDFLDRAVVYGVWLAKNPDKWGPDN